MTDAPGVRWLQILQPTGTAKSIAGQGSATALVDGRIEGLSILRGKQQTVRRSPETNGPHQGMRKKRSMHPLPSGCRTKAGEGSMPRNWISAWKSSLMVMPQPQARSAERARSQIDLAALQAGLAGRQEAIPPRREGGQGDPMLPGCALQVGTAQQVQDDRHLAFGRPPAPAGGRRRFRAQGYSPRSQSRGDQSGSASSYLPSAR